jgi:hypothetical protein
VEPKEIKKQGSGMESLVSLFSWEFLGSSLEIIISRLPLEPCFFVSQGFEWLCPRN